MHARPAMTGAGRHKRRRPGKEGRMNTQVLIVGAGPAGLPADFPNDCPYRTTATGIELCRIDIPGRATRFTATGGPDTWWPTPEPPHRINQVYLEPILFAHAAAQKHITILPRTEIVEI